MDTQHIVVDYTRYWEVIEHIGEVLPCIRITVLGLAFHIETVVLGNTSAFMVTSYQSYSIWVFDLH